MKYRIIFFTGIFAFIISSVLGQQLNPCGTQMGRTQFLKEFQAGKYPLVGTEDDWLIVPMAIHVTGENNGTGYTRTQLIGEAIHNMNAAFEQAQIQFFVSGSYHYIDNSIWHNHLSFGDGQEMMVQNNLPNVLNIYICAEAAGNCGYYSPWRDAIAINDDCLDGVNHTFAHELGHMLSLPHPFVGWEGEEYDSTQPTPNFIRGTEVEKVDGSNCAYAADGFCDTSPDYLSDRWSCNPDGLSNEVQYDPDGASFRSDGSIIMGYSTGSCRTTFTPEQIAAMRANLLIARPEVLNNSRPYQPLPDCQTVRIVKPDMLDSVQYDDPEFVWNSIPYVDYYSIQISKNINFSDLLVDENITDTTYTLSGLELGRAYFWRISAYAAHAPCMKRSRNTWFYTGILSATINLDNDNSFEAYFNGDDLVVDLENTTLRNGILFLYDLSGRRVWQSAMSTFNSQSRYNLAMLPQGTYIIHLQTDGVTGATKLVKL